jgi:uncharacterized protein YehS (DUF1456 family)
MYRKAQIIKERIIKRSQEEIDRQIELIQAMKEGKTEGFRYLMDVMIDVLGDPDIYEERYEDDEDPDVRDHAFFAKQWIDGEEDDDLV